MIQHPAVAAQAAPGRILPGGDLIAKQAYLDQLPIGLREPPAPDPVPVPPARKGRPLAGGTTGDQSWKPNGGVGPV